MHSDLGQAGPFLRWAGGKRSLLGEILPRIPKFSGKYIEPFLGAGAVFFQIPKYVSKIASDQNAELIDTYKVVRDQPLMLLEQLRQHKNEKSHYLEVRQLDRDPDFTAQDAVLRAARFIFLNKTCFNGLYRVNSRGHFNVPFGHRKNADIVSESQILRASDFLNHRDPENPAVLASNVLSGDYRGSTQMAETGDFVYLDPPYDPISSTANFVTYGKSGFTADNQEELRDEVVRLHEMGAHVMVSNSDTPLIRELYSSKIFQKSCLPVRRSISAKAAGRSPINELLITNYRPE